MNVAIQSVCCCLYCLVQLLIHAICQRNEWNFAESCEKWIYFLNPWSPIVSSSENQSRESIMVWDLCCNLRPTLPVIVENDTVALQTWLVQVKSIFVSISKLILINLGHVSNTATEKALLLSSLYGQGNQETEKGFAQAVCNYPKMEKLDLNPVEPVLLLTECVASQENNSCQFILFAYLCVHLESNRIAAS